MLAYREWAQWARRLIERTIHREALEAGRLTLHADRGASIRSKAVALLLAELGVTKTHSRPHLTNDSPYSERQFKTMKNRPEFAEQFGSYQDAQRFCMEFFYRYNQEHHDRGWDYLTPYAVHLGIADKWREQRSVVLQQAFETRPERFACGVPNTAPLPVAAWINKPKESLSIESEVQISSLSDIEQKHRFHKIPLTNDRLLVNGRNKADNQPSGDVVQ